MMGSLCRRLNRSVWFIVYPSFDQGKPCRPDYVPAGEPVVHSLWGNGDANRGMGSYKERHPVCCRGAFQSLKGVQGLSPNNFCLCAERLTKQRRGMGQSNWEGSARPHQDNVSTLDKPIYVYGQAFFADILHSTDGRFQTCHRRKRPNY